jgi:hypothetical protein
MEIRHYEAERQRDYRTMENHLYTCIYDLRSDNPTDDKRPYLNRYKAKHLCIQARKMQKDLLDTSALDSMEDEEPSLYHILRTKQRMEQRKMR